MSATPTPEDPPVFRLFNEIGIIEQLARTRFERAQPGALSLAQFTVLNHFVRLGGERSLVELARAFQVSKAAIGKLARKLDDAGYLRVRANPRDQRGKLVSITPAGRRARDAAMRAVAPQMARLAERFGEDEIARLLPALERIRVWMDAHRAD
ncbi:MAG: MarR family transcriptional regulator [Burkholderiaceae bacterium]|nr:MarR family transcriptional regulator [Burkholderiaceae bacterium]